MKLPDLKMPKLSRGGGSAPKAGLKPPKFLADLYADLRDRRLLPLVALLLVAMVAAPILLGGSDDETTPEAPPIATEATPRSASFSVVPAEANVLRAYQKRLGYREARDPFARPSSAAEGAEAESGAAESGEEETSSEGSGSEESNVVEGGEESSSGAEGESGTTHVTAKGDVVVKAKVIGFGIEAETGYVDSVNNKPEIRPMTKLPNAKHPVVVYLGPSNDKRGALLLMTSNVTAYYGKGHCVLGGQACQMLELRPGKSATFAYGFGEARYKVFMKKFVPLIRDVKVEKHFKAEGDVPGRKTAE